MNLIKENWEAKDFVGFKKFEKSLKEKDETRCEWEQNIVGTSLECFGKTSTKAKQLASEIRKGNFVSFVQGLKIENLLESLTVSHLLSQIKDFSVFEKELTKFANGIDNWASCDTLNFSKHSKESLFNLAKKFLQSEKPFVRRVGVKIYFELIKNEQYLIESFKLLDSLNSETEYYVNMCAAWLLCECFIKHREQTLKYFKNNKTNNFVINKAISKCRDSFRVSKEDKNLLLKFKK